MLIRVDWLQGVPSLELKSINILQARFYFLVPLPLSEVWLQWWLNELIMTWDHYWSSCCSIVLIHYLSLWEPQRFHCIIFHNKGRIFLYCKYICIYLNDALLIPFISTFCDFTVKMMSWTTLTFSMLVIRSWKGRQLNNYNFSCTSINQWIDGRNPACWHTLCLSLDASWVLVTSPGGWIWLAPWSASWISWCRQVASPSLCRPRHCSPGRTLNTACKQEPAHVNKLQGFSLFFLLLWKGWNMPSAFCDTRIYISLMYYYYYY